MASFRTGYQQREIPFDVNVVGPITSTSQVVDFSSRKTAIYKGDFVVLTPATATVNAYITKAASAAAATHVVAQADMTLSGNKANTEQADYRYSSLVAAQLTAAPTNKNTPTKKVALWAIFSPTDIVADTDGYDITA